MTKMMAGADVKKQAREWLDFFLKVGAVAGIIWAVLAWADATPVLSRDLNQVEVAQAKVDADQWEIVEGNQRFLMIMRFDELDRRAKGNGTPLTPQERAIYCDLAHNLGFAGVGCAPPR